MTAFLVMASIHYLRLDDFNTPPSEDLHEASEHRLVDLLVAILPAVAERVVDDLRNLPVRGRARVDTFRSLYDPVSSYARLAARESI